MVSQHNGKWGTAARLPGLAALNKDGFAQVNLVSCTSTGRCVAGGDYTGSSRHHQGFVTEGR